MRVVLSLCMLAISISASAQDLSLGLGVASPTTLSADTPLFFYGSAEGHPSTATPLDSLTVHEGPHHFELATAPPWLAPEVVQSGNDLLTFRVVALRRHWVEVVVHTRDLRWPPQTMWLDREHITFQPWAAYFLEIHSIETPEAAPIHAGPGIDTPQVGRTEAGRPLQVLETRHGWARVAYADATEAEAGPLGWVRWHDGERLVVHDSILS